MKFGISDMSVSARFCICARPARLRRYAKKACDVHRRMNWIWVSVKPMPWRMTQAPTRKEWADQRWRWALSVVGSSLYTCAAAMRNADSMIDAVT